MRPSARRRNRGFTLIEVLLVLVILVVLASLAVVAYGPIQRRANMHAATIQVGLFKEALETYQTTVGSLPTNLQALRTPPADLPDPTKWDGPYLDRDIPLDPWNHQYQYACPGTHNPTGFDVWTVTPDNQEIGNWAEEGKR
jgi:general secretion pathway protein G